MIGSPPALGRGSQLLRLLEARVDSGNPLRVGLIGAGRFGVMFLSQARRVQGLHVLGIADLAPERVRRSLHDVGWPAEQCGAASFADALAHGTTHLTEDGQALVEADGLEVIVEATGNPITGVRFAQQAIDRGRHLVMVNVEADALVGPCLAERAASTGVVYSLGYGDQPALICELAEWVHSNGFELVCAGKGTRFLPHYHRSTPDTVWEYSGRSLEAVERDQLSAQMYNSFLDGTKSAVEMAAVANATALRPQPDGLCFPPCGIDDLATVCRPRSDGGQLAHKGTVEVASSLRRDGSPVPRDIHHGVFVTFEAPYDYVRNCFREYLSTDPSGRYGSMYRPYHLVGLELTTSVLKVGLRREPTGCPVGFFADVAAVAKRDLKVGEVLDGEGGYCVHGRLLPAADAVQMGTFPIGLARDVVLRRPVPAGELLRWEDVEVDAADPVVRMRRGLERRIEE